MQQSLESKVHEAGTKSQEVSRKLQAEQLLAADLRQSLKRAESHAARAEAGTAKLRVQIQTSRSEAAAAQSKVDQQALEIAQLQKDLDRERCMHSTASGAMHARIEDLTGSSARLQEEITALHATIQVCCLRLCRLCKHLESLDPAALSFHDVLAHLLLQLSANTPRCICNDAATPSCNMTDLYNRSLLVTEQCVSLHRCSAWSASGFRSD